MQKRIYLIFIAIITLLFFNTFPLNAQGWERIINDPEGALAMSFDAKPTPDGGYIAVGEIDRPTGAVRHWIHLIKTDASGNIQWEKNINDNDITYESARAIWPVNDGYILIGSKQIDPFVNSSIYLVRTDAQGDTLWTRIYDQWEGFTTGESLYPTSDGGYIIGGKNTYDQTNSGVAIKVDANGEPEWTNIYSTGTIGIHFFDLVPTSNGGYIAAGKQDGQALTMQLDALGNQVWSQTFPITSGSSAYAVIEDTDGSFLVSGHADGFAGPSPFVLRADENGNQEWMSFPLSIGGGNGSDITFHPEGGFVVTGSLVDFGFGAGGIVGQNGFIVKFSDEGEEEWNRIFYDLDNDAITPITGSIEPTPDGGFILAGLYQNSHYLLKTDSLGNTVSHTLKGKVALDADDGCMLEDGDIPLANWIIEIQQDTNTYYTSTDAEGNYELLIDTGAYTLNLILPNAYWESCLGSVDVDLIGFYNSTTVDFPVSAVVDCPFMQVDVAIGFLRRCFDNNYTINYCNSGTQAASDATVEVNLDPFLSITAASLPYTDLGNNIYEFEIGDVGIGECGSFQITAYLDCDSTILGQAHCVEAHIFPDSLCLDDPGPLPRLDLEALCENDTIQFTITNIGDSNMAEPADFIVIEDDVMYLVDIYQLNILQSRVVRIPANGATYRLETHLIPGLTDAGQISITVEGCGTNAMGGFNIGFFNQFSMNDDEPFMDIDCRENIGAYDPNDKNAYPIGYGTPHYIEANTNLEYLIRFQNTGTDTAFRVEIRDTLSSLLEVGSVVPGASSHPYRFEVEGEGILKFIFDNIMLPDSNINEPASHGFVEFKIQQERDLPDGSLIENDAAIVFDFNAPVITNTTYHTIGSNFIDIIDATEEIEDLVSNLRVFPNPAQTQLQLDFGEYWVEEGRLELYQTNGQLVKTLNFTGNKLEINANNFPKGLYWFTILDKHQRIASGKIIIQ